MNEPLGCRGAICAQGSRGSFVRWVLSGLILTSAVSERLSAQAISTATVTQPWVVTASFWPYPAVTQTRPVGPVPANGTTVTASPVGCSSAISAWPWTSPYMVPGGTGWRVVGELRMSYTSQPPYMPVNLSTTLTGQVRLHFASASPRSGLLYLLPSFPSPGIQTCSGDVTVDLDGDGVPDFAASTRMGQAVETPITLDATGRDVVCDLNMNGTAGLPPGPGSISGSAIAAWDIVFLPDTFGLERRQLGCVPIGFGRSPYAYWVGTWQQSISCYTASQSAPGIVVGFFLLGLAEQNTPWPTSPFCPLLVDNPSLVTPTWTWTNSILMPLPDVLIPPGLHFYCQGIWLDAQNQVITSDSIGTL